MKIAFAQDEQHGDKFPTTSWHRFLAREDALIKGHSGNVMHVLVAIEKRNDLVDGASFDSLHQSFCPMLGGAYVDRKSEIAEASRLPACSSFSFYISDVIESSPSQSFTKCVARWAPMKMLVV